MNQNYVDEIKAIIDSELESEDKKQSLLQYHNSDIADAIQELTKEERIKLYHLLGDEITSEVFSYLDDVEEYVEELDKEHAADIIELMDADDAIDVLDELDEEDRAKIKSLMDEDSVADIDMITQYDEDQIGSKITTNFITILIKDDIKTAMKRVIAEAAENDNVSTIFVNDEKGKFYGSIDLRDLIIARQNDNLDDLVKTNYPFLFAEEDVSECITKLKEYDLDLIPVLDDSLTLIGVITSGDIIETVDEEMSEDYAKLAGLTGEDDIDETVFTSMRKRLPWLIILLFLGLGVSLLISRFENVVTTLPMIVFFQSLVLDMAGNVGTQSLAVTIRLVSDEEVNKKMIIKAVFKEIRIGFFNGLFLGVISFIFVFGFLSLLKQPIASDVYLLKEAFQASIIVSGALVASMTLSSFIGTIIPILFVKCHIDPAVASGPFITSINDVSAILIYYGLAFLLFIATF